jgi:hypothetical protein
MALLGHNRDFGWSLTMFQNDDTDLVALTVDPKNPNRIWHQGAWVDLSVRDETIAVKGADSVVLQVRTSPHGPVINDALPSPSSGQPGSRAGIECGLGQCARRHRLVGRSPLGHSPRWRGPIAHLGRCAWRGGQTGVFAL